VPTLDYEPHSPHLPRPPGNKLAVISLLLFPLVMIVGGWFFARLPLSLPMPWSQPPPPPPPPRYYQPGELIALPDFQTWSILKNPTVPGPYAILEDQVNVESAPGCALSGYIGTPQGPVPFESPGIPDTALRSVLVVNPAGEYDLFVLSRYEKPPAATARPATDQ